MFIIFFLVVIFTDFNKSRTRIYGHFRKRNLLQIYFRSNYNSVFVSVLQRSETYGETFDFACCNIRQDFVALCVLVNLGYYLQASGIRSRFLDVTNS
ncbi:hypothetical protein BJF84_00100 [Rhodococcus sp. CUA-806]|nr:hypothetical protein BJF84_00100 [Rhodococcus sp. CUA-806]